MTFSITVTDANAILLLSAVVCIIVVLLQVVGKASDKFSFVMLGAIASAILMQMYNFWFINEDTLQLTGSMAQFWVWIVLTGVLAWGASLIPALGAYALAALISLVGVAGSIWRGPDFIDSELGLDVSVGYIAGFWVIVFMALLAICWMDRVWRPVHVLVHAVMNSVVVVLIVSILEMYVDQANQTGYAILTFNWQLLVEYAVVFLLYSILYYYYYRQNHTHEEEKKKHKYARIALSEYATEDNKEKEALKAKIAELQQTPTPKHHIPLPPPSKPPDTHTHHHHQHTNS
jgi:hypothetical protein